MGYRRRSAHFFARFLAAFLSALQLTCGLPSPALALRVQAGREGDAGDEIIQALQKGPAPAAAAPAAGGEEVSPKRAQARIELMSSLVDALPRKLLGERVPKAWDVPGMVKDLIFDDEEGGDGKRLRGLMRQSGWSIDDVQEKVKGLPGPQDLRSPFIRVVLAVMQRTPIEHLNRPLESWMVQESINKWLDSDHSDLYLKWKAIDDWRQKALIKNITGLIWPSAGQEEWEQEIEEFLQDADVAMLGGTGYVGSHVLGELLGPHGSRVGRVRALSRQDPEILSEKAAGTPGEAKLEVIQGNHVDLAAVRRTIQGAKVVLDTAGQAWQHLPGGKPASLEDQLLDNGISAALIGWALGKDQRLVWTSSNASDYMFARMLPEEQARLQAEIDERARRYAEWARALGDDQSPTTEQILQFIKTDLDQHPPQEFPDGPEGPEQKVVAYARAFSYPYAKLLGQRILELFCREDGKDIRVLKISDVYGPGQGLGKEYWDPRHKPSPRAARRPQWFLAVYEAIRERLYRPWARKVAPGKLAEGGFQEVGDQIQQLVYDDCVAPTYVDDVAKMIFRASVVEMPSPAGQRQAVLALAPPWIPNREMAKIIRDTVGVKPLKQELKLVPGKQPLRGEPAQAGQDLALLGMENQLTPFAEGIARHLAWWRQIWAARQPGSAAPGTVRQFGTVQEMIEYLARHRFEKIPMRSGEHFKKVYFYPACALVEKITDDEEAMKSVRLARKRLGGLTLGFVVVEEGETQRVFMESGLSLKRALQRMLSAKKMDEAKGALRKFFETTRECIRRGVLNWDASIENYALLPSGDVVLLDIGGLVSTQSVHPADILMFPVFLKKGIPPKLVPYFQELQKEFGFESDTLAVTIEEEEKNEEPPKAVDWKPTLVLSTGMEEEFKLMSKEDADRQLESLRLTLEERRTPRPEWAFQDGAVADLRNVPEDVEILLVGDLHAQIGHLESILNDRDEGGLSVLEKLAKRKAVLVFLGDAFHREGEREMDSSIATAQRIAELMIEYPSSVYSLIGNHDYLTGDVRLTTRSPSGKQSVWQPGLRFRARMAELYGKEYVERFERVFLANQALMAIGRGVLALHAGPVLGAVSLEEIKRTNVFDTQNPVVRQATWSRFHVRSEHADPFTGSDADNFRKRMGQPGALLFLGHSHRDDWPWHWSPQAPEPVPYMHVIYAGRNRPGGGYTIVRNGQAKFRVPGEPTVAGQDEERVVEAKTGPAAVEVETVSAEEFQRRFHGAAVPEGVKRIHLVPGENGIRIRIFAAPTLLDWLRQTLADELRDLPEGLRVEILPLPESAEHLQAPALIAKDWMIELPFVQALLPVLEMVLGEPAPSLPTLVLYALRGAGGQVEAVIGVMKLQDAQGNTVYAYFV